VTLATGRGLDAVQLVVSDACNYIRAFSLKSGQEIWKAELPASAQATPMTYQAGATVCCHSCRRSRQAGHKIRRRSRRILAAMIDDSIVLDGRARSMTFSVVDPRLTASMSSRYHATTTLDSSGDVLFDGGHRI
jgi:hypothetical protein